MDKKEIFEKVVDICKDVFDNSELVITDESAATDIEEWDSITHFDLINDLEKEFGVSFTLAEVTESKNLGDLVDALIRHLNEK